MLDHKEKYLESPGFRDIPLTVSELRKHFIDQPYHEILAIRMNNSSEVNYKNTDVNVGDLPDEQERNPQSKKLGSLTIIEELSESDTESQEYVKILNFKIDHKRWTIFTTGAGVFSDGYINSSFSSVNVCLKRLYGKKYTNSKAIQVVSSISFAGTVFGQLFYGYLADHYSRKSAMLLGTLSLTLFTILSAGAWGIGTTDSHPGGLFEALTVYRFFLGVSIGCEYSVTSSAAAEASHGLSKSIRNRYYVWFTELAAVLGNIGSGFVPLVLRWICGEKNLTPIWRITIGIGAFAPILFFIMRLKYKEGELFKKTKFRGQPPYLLILKFYWFRTGVVSILWFLYDFVAYSFGSYVTIILDIVLGDDQNLIKVFGWSLIFKLFSLPGAIFGAFVSDYIGPRNAITIFWALDGAFAFIVAAKLDYLKKHIAGYIVLYGFFVAAATTGPGCNIGLLAAKIHPTPVRGQLYGCTAAIGKTGAFVGTYVFPIIIRRYGGFESTSGLTSTFYIAASLSMACAAISYFFLPPLDPESIVDEDNKFLRFLQNEGYDMSKLGSGNTIIGIGDDEIYPKLEACSSSDNRIFNEL